MNKKIAALAGDGIGPEVMVQALRVLTRVGELYNHQFTIAEGLIGGAAYDEFQNHFPDETKSLCENSDAILFSSVGGPINEAHLEKWQNCEVNSVLGLRKSFAFNANFRPVKLFPQLSQLSPLKSEIIERGVDLLFVRELVGDIYFGEKRRFMRDGARVAHDIAEYTEEQIASVAHIAFQSAMKRNRQIHSVDKANVLHTSKLWREVVEEVSKEYPEVTFEHILVDNCAMQIIRDPSQFDVILTPNLFGDILSDAAAVLPGSLGVLSSASINSDSFAMYEPPGGSAPDIAGKGVANPIAQILCVSMMLRHSFNMSDEAASVENAIEQVLAEGIRTADIVSSGQESVSTSAMGDAIVARLTDKK